MRAPLCFLCLKPVDNSPPIYVNGERRHAHQECMAKRLPSNHLDERERMRRRERTGPRPVGPQHVEERDGQAFIVTVLPEVKPNPKRTQKTIYRLRPGNAGRER